MSGKAWDVRGSRYVLDDHWIRVRADDCTTPAGVDVSPYYVLEFPDFVHVLALDAQDRVVLVRQYRHGFGGLSLELPGGVMEKNETDVVSVAVRELHEETGYVGDRFTCITTLSVDPARYANRLHLIGVSGVKPGPAQPDPSEDIEIVLVSRAEALQLAISGAIVNAQHVGLLMIGLSTSLP